MVLSQAGGYAQAEPIERAALAGYRTLYAADSQQVLDAEGNLAFILDNQYKYQEALRSEEHTSELQSLMRISYAVFCLKKKTSSFCFSNSQLLEPTTPRSLSLTLSRST